MLFERIKSWWRSGDRLPDGVEPLLAAYYWDGALPVPHEVREMSTQGAYIVMSEKWRPGTIMNLSLAYKKQPAANNAAANLGIGIRSRVVSHGADGVSVEFVYVNRRERQDLVKFLQSVRSRGGQ
jgi:hypothetical protein